VIRTIVAYFFLIGWSGWILLHLILIVLNGGQMIIQETNQTIAILEIVFVLGTIALGIERLIDLAKGE